MQVVAHALLEVPVYLHHKVPGVDTHITWGRLLWTGLINVVFVVSFTHCTKFRQLVCTPLVLMLPIYLGELQMASLGMMRASEPQPW